MIVLRVCACGLSHDPRSWSRLAIVSRGVENGVEIRRRRCGCGRILTVAMHEDDVAIEIDAARYQMSNAYARARVEVALLAFAHASKFERCVGRARAVRAEARAARDDAHRLEAILESIYRMRERHSPALRIGRNLIVIGGDVAEQAERAKACRVKAGEK